MISSCWYVYILQCQDGSLYTGVTTDVKRRMKMHAAGKGSKYVASKGFKQLIASQVCATQSEACTHEYAIKQLPREEKRAWFSSKAKSLKGA